MSTGIKGLDEVLLGGLPAGHLYLVEGAPGSGKTTLALKFLLQGRDCGEAGMYCTLSESRQDLQLAAASHRWSLDGVDVREFSPEPNELLPESQYTVFHPSEIELAKTTQSILDQVEAAKPQRLVIDSVAELRMLAREPIRYRRQILALKQYFANKKCTVLLLDDRAPDIRDLQLQSISHGVLILESVEQSYGGQRRRLKVLKLRAASYREGFHDYRITKGGLEVFPRLIAAEHKVPFERSVLQSGVAGLDELLGGGIDFGTSTLVVGPTGSGKSTIAAHYAVAVAQSGKRATYLAFDEGTETLKIRAASLGIGFTNHLENGALRLQQIDPTELSPGEFSKLVRSEVEEHGSSLIVIDSVNGLFNAMPGEKDLRIQIHELISYLNGKGVATFLTLAQYGLLGPGVETPFDISYLSDTLILIRYFEAEGAVKQAISVFKRRSGAHERTLREFRMDSHGIQVGVPLTGFRGVLLGVPELSGPGGSTSNLLNDDNARK